MDLVREVLDKAEMEAIEDARLTLRSGANYNKKEWAGVCEHARNRIRALLLSPARGSL